LVHAQQAEFSSGFGFALKQSGNSDSFAPTGKAHNLIAGKTSDCVLA
jgi:hypothetical protein